MLARLMALALRGGEHGGRRACYGIAATCAWLLLFCVLAVALRCAWKAFAFASLALVAFGAVDHFAPDTWCGGAPSDGAGAPERDQSRAAAAATARRFGLGRAAIDALPTFAYGDDGGDVDLESGGDTACSVCLEDLRAGETVRRLPACMHVFHVECIDMWLHSHRSCPLCRCDLSPPRKVVTKAPAVENGTLAEDELPAVAATVAETGPLADDHDASPPVVTGETKPPAGASPTV
ncbi:hypothetical protein CFC21_072282 [Triticum aestivum]|uniref:RING-type E3 ubiquitin transferase n=2 Tax=Triticum aestivum TaxID=4565 RepID=A0A3B6LMT1_WHEAT|nr:RING-H2 finger protein ATL39-like [Triticum aestivum]KAF7066268.1 hypothetical protein CFC21_072282 [Triticum aestivum]